MPRGEGEQLKRIMRIIRDPMTTPLDAIEFPDAPHGAPETYDPQNPACLIGTLREELYGTSSPTFEDNRNLTRALESLIRFERIYVYPVLVGNLRLSTKGKRLVGLRRSRLIEYRRLILRRRGAI